MPPVTSETLEGVYDADEQTPNVTTWAQWWAFCAECMTCGWQIRTWTRYERDRQVAEHSALHLQP